jgi:hypothetical protein
MTSSATARIVVEETHAPSRGTGWLPGDASAYLEVGETRVTVEQWLAFGFQADYTGTTEMNFAVELHAVDDTLFVRVEKTTDIHYGPTETVVSVYAWEPQRKVMVAIEPTDHWCARLSEGTRLQRLEWPRDRLQ